MNINKFPLISFFFSPLKEGVRWNVCWKGCVISIISINLYISIGFAQISIDSSNFSVPGLSLNRFYAWAEPDSINFGNPGPAQSYDFSNSHIIINDSINYIDATLTPFTNEHSGAIVALQTADEINYKSAMGYVSVTKPGIIRGPHEHVNQSDCFIFVGPGSFELHLWDRRGESDTKGEHMKLEVRENNPTMVIVPPGVVHGYKCVSKTDAYSINLPNKLYKGKNKQEEIDEIRWENQSGSPYQID